MWLRSLNLSHMVGFPLGTQKLEVTSIGAQPPQRVVEQWTKYIAISSFTFRGKNPFSIDLPDVVRPVH